MPHENKGTPLTGVLSTVVFGLRNKIFYVNGKYVPSLYFISF